MGELSVARDHYQAALVLDPTYDRPARTTLDAGNRFTIDSDAHYLGEFDNLDWGVSQARRAWLEPRDVLNTLSLEGFLAAVTDHS